MGCPTCRVTEPRYFKDKKSELKKGCSIYLYSVLTLGHREIQALGVRCVERDCGWEGTVGTLEDHMTKCDFTMTPCPDGCKDANEVIIKYFRKELEEHVSSECPGREYQCQDCGLKDKYRVITGPHEDECEKKMVSCLNKECDSILERGCVQEHVQLSCNYTEVSCEYMPV